MDTVLRLFTHLDCSPDIFLVEALLNGILLAGLLALLALGLNLIFGVIDVVWICYAELVMVGMYGINFAYKGGAPFLLAALFGILLTAASRRCPAFPRHPTGARQRADQPAARHRRRADLPAGRRHHGVRHRLQEPRPAPGLGQCRRHELLVVAHCRLRRGARRHAGAVAVPQAHLSRHRHPRHLPGPADHAADGRRQPQALPRHLGHRRRARRPRRHADGAAVRHLPADRPAVRAADLHDLRAGRPRQHDRRLRRRLHHRPVHRRGGSSCLATEWGYAVAFLFFMVAIFIRPQGLFGGKS